MLMVYHRLNNQRPEVDPHDNFDHQLVLDYYSGITKAQAEKRINDMLEAVHERERGAVPAKPWWKIW